MLVDGMPVNPEGHTPGEKTNQYARVTSMDHDSCG